jgi:hypothetical protein
MPPMQRDSDVFVVVANIEIRAAGGMHEDLRGSARAIPKCAQILPGCAPRLRASTAVGIDGRLEFDSSNRGLC